MSQIRWAELAIRGGVESNMVHPNERSTERGVFRIVVEIPHTPTIRLFLTTMSSQCTTLTVFLLAFLIVVQYASAMEPSSDEMDMMSYNFQRTARAPKPKFIRFGRAGAKFIRFGRSGENTWGGYAPSSSDFYVKRGAKFIRFG